MKNIISAIIFLLVGQFAFAQQNNYKWRVGVHGGLNSYYGDLSSERIFDPSSGLLDLNNTDQIAYGLSVEKSLSKAWGVRLLASRGQFTANDRTTNLDGELFLDNENFDRSLNAQTSFTDASLMMNYYFDNGKLFSDEAFFSPYFGIGIGFNKFEVKGDLYDTNGQRYYYWSDNTVRNMSELDPDANTAVIIEQDGEFETDLTALQTEGKNYQTSTFTIPALIGLKFRLGNRFNFNIESLVHYSGSDYMDDVHGEYLTTYDSPLQQYAANPSGITAIENKRGNDDRLKDFYAFFSASLHYNFGFKKDAFEAPIFYLGQKDAINTPTTTIVEDERTIIVNTEDLSTNGVDKEITVTVVTDTIVKDGKTEIIEITIVDDQADDNSPEIQEGELVIEKLEWNTEEPKEEVIVIEIEEEVQDIEERVIIIEEEPVVIEEEITAVEPLGPVEPIETIRLSPTLSEEEIILADVQDAQIEVLEIENDIYDMQASGEKDTEKLDSLYTIIEGLDKRLSAYENYHNQIAIQGNDNYSRPENQAIWEATAELKSELTTIRQEIRETSTSSSPSISVELHEKMQKENAERIASLEKELAATKRKAEKDAKKAAKEPREPKGWAMNDSRKEKEVIEIKETTTVVVPTPVQVEKSELVDNAQNLEAIKMATETSANVKMLEARIASMEKSLRQQKKVNNPSTVFVPQQKDNASANQINALNQKVDQLSRELAAAKQALATKPKVVEVKPAPVVVVPTPTPAPSPAPTRVIVSAAKEAIRGYESTNVFFQTGQSSIAPEFKTRLSTIATFIRQYPELRAALTGFTDKSGNPEANFALSKRRSEAVKTYLLSQGVSPTQIEATYFGDTQAAAANDPYSRRVEINLRTY